MNYKKMSIEDIIDWCKKNNQVNWLKKTVSKTTKYKVYPRKKITNEEGKKVSVADKDKKPTIKERPISFIQIKREFCEKFMPEILPVAKEKAPTMYDLISKL